MADNFQHCELGECISTFEESINCTVATGKTIVKGQVVEFAAEVVDGLPTIQPAAAGSLVVAGVARNSGAAGATVNVLTKGITKVTAGTGGTTVGKKIMVGGEEGVVMDADAYDKAIGRAYHTLAKDDIGLILVNV